MNPYQHENVVYLHAYRQYAPLRERLIREWKNPLLRASKERFNYEKNELAKQILANPHIFELRVKWQLLMEVERG